MDVNPPDVPDYLVKGTVPGMESGCKTGHEGEEPAETDEGIPQE